MFRSNLIWIREQSKFKILDKKKKRKKESVICRILEAILRAVFNNFDRFVTLLLISNLLTCLICGARPFSENNTFLNPADLAGGLI